MTVQTQTIPGSPTDLNPNVGAVSTAKELALLPSGQGRYELVKGELRTMPPASHGHGNLANNFAFLLTSYVRAHKLGQVYAAETGFILARNPDTVRAPDAAFIRQDRLSEVEGPGGYWPGAPDLAAEVISPGDLYTEVAEKVKTGSTRAPAWCW